MKIFIDSNFYCGFYNEADTLHKATHEIFRKLDDHVAYTSKLVLFETYTILSQRVGKLTSIGFNDFIYKKSQTIIVDMDANIESFAWKTFKSISNKNISFVDASNLAFMNHYDINNLLSYDKDYIPLQKDFKFKLFL